MIKTEKLGEIRTKIIDEVKKTDELKVLLRYGWGMEITGRLAFHPSEDLKIGDEVKVIIEKVYNEPEPEEEAVAAEAEGGEEASADKVAEPPKAEGEESATAGAASEPLKAEAEEGTAEVSGSPEGDSGGESPAGEIKNE